MTPRLVIVLGLAAAVSTGGAIAAWQANHDIKSVEGTGQRLVPELVERINDVTAVSVRQGEHSLRMARGETGWQIEGSGYPVAVIKLQNAVIGLAQMVRLEPKTAKKAKYPVIAVDAQGKAGAKGRQFELTDSTGKTVTKVIVGNSAPGRGTGGRSAQYARLSGDEHSWLVLGDVRQGAKLGDWIDTQLVKLDPKKITAASIRHADGDELSVRRSGTTEQGTPKFSIDGVPPNIKVKSSIGVRYTATDLGNIRFEDVRAAGGAGELVSTAEVVTDSGLKLGYRVVEDNGQAWLSLHVIAKGSDPAAGEKIAAKASGWEFALEPSKAVQFKKRLSDLLELEPAGVGAQ